MTIIGYTNYKYNDKYYILTLLILENFSECNYEIINYLYATYNTYNYCVIGIEDIDGNQCELKINEYGEEYDIKINISEIDNYEKKMHGTSYDGCIVFPLHFCKSKYFPLCVCLDTLDKKKIAFDGSNEYEHPENKDYFHIYNSDFYSKKIGVFRTINYYLSKDIPINKINYEIFFIEKNKLNRQFTGIQKKWHKNGGLIEEYFHINGKIFGEYKIYWLYNVKIIFELFNCRNLSRVYNNYDININNIEINMDNIEINSILYPNYNVSENVSKCMQLLQTCEYINNKKNGKLKRYYDNGILQIECDFIDDKKNGKFKIYYNNGILKEECYYVNDKKHGKFITYNNNSELKIECDYIDHQKHGEENFYDKNNNIIQKNYYINNEYKFRIKDIIVNLYNIIYNSIF